MSVFAWKNMGDNVDKITNVDELIEYVNKL
jgi:hypothetical protein